MYSIYGETIAGVAVLRAFGASSKFLRDMLRCVDTVSSSSLADDLHDVVPLALNTGFESQVPDICMMNYRYLAIEVVTDELKRIQQRLNSCELDLL